MTIVEKAAYLKGLTEGLGVDPESRDGSCGARFASSFPTWRMK